jgi:hypothetical protein
MNTLNTRCAGFSFVTVIAFLFLVSIGSYTLPDRADAQARGRQVQTQRLHQQVAPQRSTPNAQTRQTTAVKATGRKPLRDAATQKAAPQQAVSKAATPQGNASPQATVQSALGVEKTIADYPLNYTIPSSYHSKVSPHKITPKPASQQTGQQEATQQPSSQQTGQQAAAQ